MRSFATSLIILVGTACASLYGQSVISGVVRNMEGQPVRGAIVTLTPAQVDGAEGQAFAVVSSGDGTYSFPSVPNGNYRVCGKVRGGKYINPCLWGEPAPSLDVVAGQDVTNVVLVLPDGVPLHVRLDDANRILKHHNRPGSDRPVFVSVVAPGPFLLDAESAVADEEGRTDRLVVPADRDVRIIVHGPGIEVHDEKDRKLTARDPEFGVKVRKDDKNGKVLRFKVKKQAE